MTTVIVKRVNELNGGPVTEGKVLTLIEEARTTGIKNDIKTMEKQLRSQIEP